MDPVHVAIVIASAVTHAAWNVLTKRAGDKEAYMWLMTTTSLVTVLPVYLVVLDDWGLPVAAVPYLLVSAVAEVLYFLSLGRAYELGDLSVVYPLARSSPLIVTVLAVFFLNEEVTAWGAAGILLMVLGVYTIHLRSLRPDDLTLPLRSLRSRASQYALLTALCTTVYSLSDKAGVTVVSPIAYSFWLEIFIFPLMTVAVLWRRGRGALAAEWRSSGRTATVGGFLMRFGYVMVLFVMSQMQVSYILALRQVSIVLGAVAGVLLLGESYGTIRLVSSIIMFLGVYILAVLA